MRIRNFIALLFAIFAIGKAKGQEKKFIVHTVAFYNLENIFDTINNPNNDEEWLPNGAQNWTSKKYRQKLKNLARVISEIGTSENPNAPTLLGGSEIENRGVLEDLVKEPALLDKDYGIVHFDSPDKRGIDVALLYQKKHFIISGTWPVQTMDKFLIGGPPPLFQALQQRVLVLLLTWWV